MIEFPSSYNAPNPPWTDKFQQNFGAVCTNAISQEQIRLIQRVENNQLYLTNRERRLPEIVLREPSEDHDPNRRVHCYGKKPIKDSDLNETRKKKKVAVIETGSEEDSATSSQEQNPNFIGDSSNVRPNQVEPLVPLFWAITFHHN